MSDPVNQKAAKVGRVVFLSALGVVGLFVVLLFVIFSSSGKPSQPALAPVVEKPDTPENQDPIDVLIKSQSFMEDRLKAPQSAKWPYLGDKGVQVGFATKSHHWVVSSYVDSQNSFGAMIRTLYVMSLEYIPGQGWKMADLQAGEQ